MTNETEVISNTSSQEVFNQVLLEILTGTKEVGADFYSASKLAITNTTAFALEQAPQIFEELIRLTIFTNSIKIGFYLLTVGIMIHFNKKFFAYCKAENNDLLWACYTAKIISCFAFFIIGFNFCVLQAVSELLKAVLAPKVFLIETVFDKIGYLKSLL